MQSQLISVVIPVYKQAEYVSEAIQSVLDQTYQNFEVLVVNDASPDNASETVLKFKDPRVKLIVHEENRGLPAARNTGIRASTGEIIGLLDADDLFHPAKLQAHIDFLCKHPEIGVTYNPRFDLNHSDKTIRQLWRPPLAVGLRDFILGFPFGPSDMMMRREWVFGVGLFDESYVNGGEDTDLPCRLALAGCQFASVDRALNYRRYHSDRRRKNLPSRLDDVVRALNATFDDPRCPSNVLDLRSIGLKHHLMVLAFLALSYGDTVLGQKYVREIVRIDSSVLKSKPCELIEYMLEASIEDESIDHAALLRSVIDQLPSELAYLSDQYDWAVAHGYLLRGTRAIIWGRLDDGKIHFAQAVNFKTQIDEAYMRNLAYQLFSYELEFGNMATQEVIQNLTPYLEKIGGRSCVSQIKGDYSFHKAFRSYISAEYSRVPGEVFRSIAYNPDYLLNRGLVAILFRSIINSLGNVFHSQPKIIQLKV